ncbi:MAG: hypothetical protein WBA67_16160 [Jannaschia sp.]
MPGIVVLRRQFGELPEEVRGHLSKLGPLLDSSELELALAYLFMKIEQGRYRTIKCFLIRRLKCQASIIDGILKNKQLTRKSFRKTVQELSAANFSEASFDRLDEAEKVRDAQIHGRPPSQESLRGAICDAMAFVRIFGEDVRNETNKNPFGNLQGLSSRIRTLTSIQSEWIIRGVLAAGEKK